MSTDVSTVHKVCRCCLEQDRACTNVFTTLCEFQNKISDLLLDCTGISISEQDFFSKEICDPCLVELTNANRFRVRCLASQETLQSDQLVVRVLQSFQPIDPNNSALQGIGSLSADLDVVNSIDQSSQNYETTDSQTLLVADVSAFQNPVKIEESDLKLEDATYLLGTLLNEPTRGACFEDSSTFSNHNQIQVENTVVEEPHQLSIYGNVFNDVNSPVKLLPQLPADHTQASKCHICSEQFQTTKLLIRHRRLNHTGRTSKCPKCKKGFSCRSLLAKHMIIHSSEQPHKCDSCDQRFHFKGCLLKHRKTHNVKQTFTAEVLSTSDVKDDGEQQQQSDVACYDCDLCGKQFMSLTRNKLKY
ncbi:zinc finger protein 267-like [Sabethes cyaneus]|uniref:zinc finger protein 267-like n=1 Tax=Sabethes cyaneus TaxID=53552 RepID=UPI00237ED5B3|nr:zinc finger protein 267-like [Sabethes cyaneus]